ncbi:MAG: hypothetical protein EBZ50_09205 [Alphaproteobacteria bacterium]|nr:hypothetical protein [Alphaproteobacteria bacterium]
MRGRGLFRGSASPRRPGSGWRARVAAARGGPAQGGGGGGAAAIGGAFTGPDCGAAAAFAFAGALRSSASPRFENHPMRTPSATIVRVRRRRSKGLRLLVESTRTGAATRRDRVFRRPLAAGRACSNRHWRL